MRCGSSNRVASSTTSGQKASWRATSSSHGWTRSDVRFVRQLRMPLARGGLDVGEPRVRVLRVKDRVLIALRERQLEVELDRRVGRAKQVEVAHGVAAHSLHE